MMHPSHCVLLGAEAAASAAAVPLSSDCTPSGATTFDAEARKNEPVCAPGAADTI